ncbi:MAG: galactokinase [Alkalispirochaetaceae bacterium]
MSRIGKIHLSEFGSEPTVVTEAPTVATLLGALGAYNDGVSLRLVTPPSVRVALRPRDDSVVRFSAPDLKERKRASLSTIRGRKEDRWARLPKAMVQLLASEGLVTQGADITLQSDAPPGCGLSLTSAYSVALIEALTKVSGRELSTVEVLDLVGRLGKHYLKRTPSETLRLKESAELQKIAEPGRIYACDSRRGVIEGCDWHSVEGHEVVLISAGVPQFSDDMSLQEIENFQREALVSLGERRPGVSLRDYRVEDLEEIREALSDAARRAATFVVGENGRVEEARELLLAGDLEGVGNLLSVSHGSLRENLDLSCPEIDWLVKRGQRVEGVVGMRIHGLAYGGAALALLRPGALDRLVEAIDEYSRIFGFSPEIYTLVLMDGSTKGVNVRQLEG